MENLKEYLEKIAKTAQEVEDICAASGGNYDDAYSIGLTNGEAGLAKELLDKYFSNLATLSEHFPIQEEKSNNTVLGAVEPLTDTGMSQPLMIGMVGIGQHTRDVTQVFDVKLEEKKKDVLRFKEVIKKWDTLLLELDEDEKMSIYAVNIIQEIISDFKEVIQEGAIAEGLKEYFDKTPNEKIQEDWDKTKDLDSGNGVTIGEFMKTLNEPTKYDFICPHSGEGFMFEDIQYRVYADEYDDKPNKCILRNSEPCELIACFHKEEDAIKWNRDKFGKEKLSVEQRLEAVEKKLGI